MLDEPRLRLIVRELEETDALLGKSSPFLLGLHFSSIEVADSAYKQLDDSRSSITNHVQKGYPNSLAGDRASNIPRSDKGTEI